MLFIIIKKQQGYFVSPAHFLVFSYVEPAFFPMPANHRQHRGCETFHIQGCFCSTPVRYMGFHRITSPGAVSLSVFHRITAAVTFMAVRHSCRSPVLVSRVNCQLIPARRCILAYRVSQTLRCHYHSGIFLLSPCQLQGIR